MKIPQKFPQFEKFPALFITCGEYEAHFHIVSKGNIETKEIVKMAPRDEAKEKQMFTGKKAGVKDLSSFSHQGAYTEDLKRKFTRQIHKLIHDILAEYKLKEIYIFAPKYVTNRIIRGLENEERKLIRMQFYKEYTKENPLQLIELVQKEIDNIQKEIVKTPLIIE